MIPPAAVEAFKNRERRDNRIAENWTPLEVAIEVAKLPIRPPFWEIMRREQRITVLLAIRDRCLAMFLDMGLGKTLVVLSLVLYFRETEGTERFLVGVPNRTNKDEWMAEAAKWCPDLPVVALPSVLAEKVAALSGPGTIFVDTYGGITHLVTSKQPRRKKKGNELVIDPKLVKSLVGSLDGVVADESSFLGNHDSLQTRIFDHLSRPGHMLFWHLSGTPFGRDPTPLQPQIKMIDRGWSLGETLGMFRAVFFSESDGHWARKDYKFLAKNKPLLDRYLAHASVRFTLDKSELPAVTRKRVMISLPNDAAVYYERARKALKAAAISGDVRGLKSAFNNLRAISSGFLPIVLDDDEKTFLDFKENYKLDALMDQLRTIGDHKFIVIHYFRHSGEILAAAMAKAKIKTVLINGGVKDMGAARDRFINDPKVQGLLLAADAGAFGLNLQVAKYGFVYESPVPVITRKQVLRRFIRPAGAHDRVVLCDLVARGTVDERILEFHKKGADLFKAVLKGSVAL